MISFFKAKNKNLTNEAQKALEEETQHIAKQPLDEETRKNVELELQKLDLKKHELKNQEQELKNQEKEAETQSFIARGVIYMSTLSLLSLYAFAGLCLYSGKNEDAKNFLNSATNGTTYLTTAVIAYYFGAKKHQK